MKKQGKSLLIASLLAMSLTACSEEVIEMTVDPLTVRIVSPVTQDFYTTGSSVASLEPGSRVTVTPGVSGELERVYVSLGDTIRQGDLICTVDPDAAYTQRDNAEDSVTRAYENLQTIQEGLLVRAPVSGYVQSIEGKLDYAVASNTQLAYLNNQKTMSVKIPFLESFVDSSWIGKRADLSFIDTGESLLGTVTEISGTSSFIYENIAVVYVTIEVENPGSIKDGRRVAAEVNGVTCSADGSFESTENSAVLSGLNGTLDEIYVKVGDYVQAGQTMFRVVSTSTDSQILNAENNISDALEARQDAYDLIGDYRITAPISGTVSDVYSKALDQVGGTTAIIEISTLDQMEVTFSVSESVVPYLYIGQHLDIKALSGDATGKITEIASVANTNTGLFTIKGQVLGNALLSGTTATVTYRDFIETNAMVIPFEAVQFIGEKSFVFLVEDNLAVKKEVVLSKFNADEVIVVDGLTESDRVISTWSSQLRNSLEVREEGASTSSPEEEILQSQNSKNDSDSDTSESSDDEDTVEEEETNDSD